MQVTMMLRDLDSFLKRVEPDIDGITGEEKDTASFMKLMRVFNEVRYRKVNCCIIKYYKYLLYIYAYKLYIYFT